MSRSLPNKSIQAYANKIQSHWSRATKSIMEAAKLCAEANEVLSTTEKRALWKKLPFGESTFSKLATIGAHPRLNSAGVEKLLPPSLSTIHLATQLTEKQLDRAI